MKTKYTYAIVTCPIIFLVVAIVGLLSSCSSQSVSSNDVVSLRQVSLLEGQINNFIKDLESTQRGCIVHSTSQKKTEVDTKALNAVIENLRFYANEKSQQKVVIQLTLVGNRNWLYHQVLSNYQSRGLDVRYRKPIPNELDPPYESLCSGASGLYITDLGVGYFSGFKSKDRGGTTIIVLVGSGATRPSLTNDNSNQEIKQTHPKRNAGEYYDKYIK